MGARGSSGDVAWYAAGVAVSTDDMVTVVAPSVAAGTTPIFELVLVEGPDAGHRQRLDALRPSRLLIGLSPVCDLALHDSLVSRRHAALEIVGRRLRVTDLGSTNGTFVNAVAVVDAFAASGDRIQVGNTVIRIEPYGDEPASALAARTSFGRTIGQSMAMRRLYPLCERLAATDVTVVIEGETGTGKEVLAESIHDEGARREQSFVVFDCTAVAPTLVESELFGHERGSFTGATELHRGVFEQASGGTLLIDEIGDLDLKLQSKLLRALQNREIRRLGSARPIAVDVRVLAATRRSLEREVQAGRFRDDLYYRLAVARIELPPLRSRDGDVPVLAQAFWRALGGGAAGVPYETMRRFEDYDWPGNVRELHNAVARLVALGSLAVPDPAVPISARVADYLEQVLALDLPLPEARERVVSEFQRRYVRRMLDRHGGNVNAAARASGIARRYFQLLKAKAR